jgi:hypothetical protein
VNSPRKTSHTSGAPRAIETLEIPRKMKMQNKKAFIMNNLNFNGITFENNQLLSLLKFGEVINPCWV